MLDNNKSESKHLASLDFDISGISPQMQEIERIVKATGITLKKVVDNNFDMSKILAKERKELKVELNKIEADIKSSLNNPSVNTLEIKVSTEKALKNIEKLQKEYKNFQKQIQETNTPIIAPQQSPVSPQLPNNNTFGIASRSRSFLAIQGIVGAERLAINSLQTLTDVEYKVMEITRVMNDSTLNIQSFQEELFNLAVGYGRSFDDVSEVALRFAQAGYSVKDTLSMTKDSLLALNTAELDVENSTQSMIGIMQQWGYTASELSTIIDKVNYTADNNPITSQDLVDGLLQAGAAAKTAKISFNDTIGTLTAMKEASGRTGREVGNAFKSIIAYTQRDKSFATFESLGIEVFTDKARTMLRPTLDLLSDLSDAWKQNGEIVVDTLIKDESAAELLNENMAELIGSSENYSAVKKAESDANNQSLSDMERLDAVQTAGMHRRTYFISLLENFNKIQEVSNDLQKSEGYSLTENARHMETLKAKTIQLVESLKQLAIQAGEAGLLDIAKGAVDAATALTNVTKNAGGLAVPLTLVLGVVVALKREKIASGMLDLSKNVTGLVTNFNKLKTSAVATSGAINTVGVSTQSLLGFIGLATIAITAIIATISYYNNKAIEARQATIDAGLAANGTIKSITELKEKYNDLSGVSSKTTEQEEVFKNVQKELITLLGDKADTLKNLTEGTETYRLELEKLTEAEIESQKLALTRAENATNEKVNSLSKGFIDGNRAIVMPKGGYTNGLVQDGKYANVVDEKLGEFARPNKQGLIEYKMPKDDIEGQLNWYKAQKELLNELTNQKAFDSSIYRQINEEVTRLAPTMEEYLSIQKNLGEVSKLVNETLTEQSQKTKGLSDIVKTNRAAMSSSNASIDETQTKLQELADLHDLVSQKEKVSSSQILDLIQKYPQYATEIANVNNNKQAMIDITKTLAEQEKKAAIVKLEDDKKQIQSNLSLISSTLNVAKAKLFALQMDGGETKYGTIISNTQKQISDFEAESKNALIGISAIDNAIKELGTLDLSTYSKKNSSGKDKENAIKKQTEAINEQIAAFEHLNSMGVYTLQQQIDFYKELSRTTKGTVETQRKIETSLFNLYKKQVDEKIKLAEKEKNAKIKAIKDSTDSQIKALQRIKDERDSERSEEDYNSERANILEQMKYWEQRTGQEATTSLKGLKEQLAKLDKNYQRKLEDDETEAEIKRLENKRDREIEHIEKTWEELQSVFDSENLAMIDKSKLFASGLFTEYDMNFLKPFIDKIALIRENMRKLATEEQARRDKAEEAKAKGSKIQVKQAYASGTLNAKQELSLVGEYGPEIMIPHSGNGIVPANATKNLMEIGQYSLNQIMDKAQFKISPTLQSKLGSDMQRLQQNYSNSVNNNYNNTSSDNKRSTVINNKIINNNHIEDMADGQALANTVGRQLLSKMKNLPK